MKTHLKAQSIRIAVLCVLLVVCVALTTAVVATWPERGFVPPSLDNSARHGEPNVTGFAFGEPREINMGQSIGLSGQCRVEGRTLYMYFANHEDNNLWMSLELRRVEPGRHPRDFEVIASTGLLVPGTYVESMRLPRGVDVSEGHAFFVMFYDPYTYRAMGAVQFELSFAD
jgi:hypothetical protein